MSDNNKNNFTIKITQGMEHHSNLMNIYDEEAFFYDSYRQAAYAITRIVEMSRFEFAEREKQKDCNNYRRNREYHNNIVAFCADRGQGKTSAMLSMAYALHNMSAEKNGIIDNDKKKEDKNTLWKSAYDSVSSSSNNSANPVLDTHFECLPVIDPSCFEKSDSILRTVLSKMFKSASQKWQDNSNCSSSMYRNANEKKRQQKEELANKFLKCFKGLDYLYKEEKKEISSYYDDLNMAAEFSDSNNFRTMFIELVESYLKFMSFSSSDTKNTMLVILIDDADLSTKRAFSIVEEIQKYFVMPGVLILMALHVGTLARTLEQNQLEHYKTLMDYSNDPTIKERCHRAMERYIEKLFPTSHRIYLPDISKVIEQDYNFIKLSYLDKDGNDIFKRYKYLAKPGFTDNYENRLFLLIYAKTGIILTKQGNYLHEFLPNSFRQLNHFLFYLNSMEDIVTPENKVDNKFDLFQYIMTRKSKEDRTKAVFLWLKNLNSFQDYFMHTWCPEKLTSEQLRYIEEINKSPSGAKNFNTVEMLRRIINKENDINQILDIREQPIKNSGYTPMSDVIWALYRLKHSVQSIYYLSFIYAIRIYYSIYIHIAALQGILVWLEDNMAPFDDLFYMLGGRIFPMHYYVKKRLPFYIFNINIEEILPKMTFESYESYLSYLSTNVKFMYQCDEQLGGVVIKEWSQEDIYFTSKGDYPTPRARYSVYFRADANLGKSEHQFFDFLKPIVMLLKSYRFNLKKSYHKQDKPIEEFSETPNGTYSALNLICNLDLQEIIYKKVFKRQPFQWESPLKINLNKVVVKIYDEFDTEINNGIVMNIKSEFCTQLKYILPGDTFISQTPFSVIGKDMEKTKFWKLIDYYYIANANENENDIIALSTPTYSLPSKTEKQEQTVNTGKDDEKKEGQTFNVISGTLQEVEDNTDKKTEEDNNNNGT